MIRVSPYRLARRRYWIELRDLLYERYERFPTSEGHRVADEAFRRSVPLRKLARRIAKDRKLSRSIYEIAVEPLF